MYDNAKYTPNGVEFKNLENASDYAKIYPPATEKVKKKIKVTSQRKRFGGTK